MSVIRGICLDGCYYAAGLIGAHSNKQKIETKRTYRSVVLALLDLYAADKPELKERCSDCMRLYMKGEREAERLDPIGFDQ